MSHRPTNQRSRSLIEHSKSKTHRSRSPRNRSSLKRKVASGPVILPYQAPQLNKDDFATYKSMFGLYLDIQKHLFLDELPQDEVKGRWKSFIGKWYVLSHPETAGHSHWLRLSPLGSVSFWKLQSLNFCEESWGISRRMV